MNDDGMCPDDVSSVPWKEDRCLMWDATCPDTLATSYMTQADIGPGAVANLRKFKRKNIRKLLVPFTYLNQLQ